MKMDWFAAPGRVSRMAALSAGVWVAAAGISAAQESFSFTVTAYKQAVAESLGEVSGDVAAFYRARGFEPLWTGADTAGAARRAALFEALRMAEDHGLPAGRYDAPGLMARLAAARTGRERGLAEMALTQTYLRFAHDLQSGILEPNDVVSAIKRERPVRADADLLTRLETGEPRAAMRGLVPQTPEYTRLVRAKLMLERKIASGGWGAAVPASKLEPGDSGRAVIALRDRLVAMGFVARSASATYDAALTEAVRRFQQAHNLETDGVAGPSTIGALNVSPEERLKSIIVAMERERWLNLPEGRGKRHVLVNLVDFHARIIDDGKVSFETRSVVGHQDYDRQTPEFSDEMEHMVINPSWYVPRSIIVKEYLPMLRRNPGAVSHIQIVDSRGRVVGRGQSFAQYSGRSFPFSMRQPPGPRNALGSVKFMFPNKHAIYLHDTPSQNLFTREVRTFSHGCIRLDDPHEFAYALLARQTDDPVGTFQSILRTGRETKVPLDQAVPVHLIYRTAFTKAKGRVQFRDDVYGRDARIWDALAREGVALRAGRS